jgi:magnesium transporter
VLTIFSVFFLPLTLISGIFGMNNHIPGENSTLGFWVVVGVMVGVIAGMWFYFRKRDWL